MQPFLYFSKFAENSRYCNFNDYWHITLTHTKLLFEYTFLQIWSIFYAIYQSNNYVGKKADEEYF